MKEESIELLHTHDNTAEQHFENAQQLLPWERPALRRLEANSAAFMGPQPRGDQFFPFFS